MFSKVIEHGCLNHPRTESVDSFLHSLTLESPHLWETLRKSIVASFLILILVLIHSWCWHIVKTGTFKLLLLLWGLIRRILNWWG